MELYLFLLVYCTASNKTSRFFITLLNWQIIVRWTNDPEAKAEHYFFTTKTGCECDVNNISLWSFIFGVLFILASSFRERKPLQD